MSLDAAQLPLSRREEIDDSSATSDKPLAFFKKFFISNGLATFRNNFTPSDEEYQYSPVVDYNAEQKSKTYIQHFYDGEDEYEEETTVYFKDQLKEKLVTEYYRCIDALDDKIDTLVRDKSEITNYLTIQLSRLKRIIDAAERNTLAMKYESVMQTLNNLVRFIVKRYRHYLSPDIIADFRHIEGIDYKPPFTKLTLKMKPQEFVKLFGDMLKEKTIELKGISDVKPIVEVLASVFEIPKGRGQGMVSPDSLLTEFKKFMAERP